MQKTQNYLAHVQAKEEKIKIKLYNNYYLYYYIDVY